mmetsp:Transcript_6989/g.26403  ORF Transcript_6989/g.26403 Transcript_6989/m.26403 type:complete len:222 (+) Transcript_6989:1460-2125(+)
MASYQLASFKKSRTCVGGVPSTSRICRIASTSSTIRSTFALAPFPEFARAAAFASSCFSIFCSEDCNRLAKEVVCLLSADSWFCSLAFVCSCSCAATTARPVMSLTDSISPFPASEGTDASTEASTLGGSTVTAATALTASRMVCSGRNFTNSVTAKFEESVGTESDGCFNKPLLRTSSQSGNGTPNVSNRSGSSLKNGSFPPSSASPTTYSFSLARVAAT